MTLRITTGSPAEGEDKYFPRPLLTQKIWRKIDAGENLLIAAPRRVGKTSLLKAMLRNPQPDCLVKYLIVQAVDGENEFYKLLYNELIGDPQLVPMISRYCRKTSAAVRGYMRKIKDIGLEQISFDHNATLDFHAEVLELLHALDNNGRKLIIVVDEFPHAVENILRDDLEQGLHFLQTARAMRQDTLVREKVCFIYTGSIGLHNVVKKIDQINLINDLVTLDVPPLTRAEAVSLIERLVAGLADHDEITLNFPMEAIDHLLTKMDWLIPYFCQILVDELGEMGGGGAPVDCRAVDEAFGRIIKNRQKYEHYFEHWKSRLKAAFDPGGHYKLALEFLNLLATGQRLDKALFHDLAIKHGVEEPNIVRNSLEYDGYINEQDGIFRFNSPILKEWWFLNVAS